MAILNIKILNKIIAHLPEDFTIEYNNKTTVIPLEDCIEIDVSEKRVILK